MKRISITLVCFVLVFGLSLSAMGAETLSYAFDGDDTLTTVTNTLKAGGNARISEGVLSLDGTYGLKLGYVGNTFTVSAMVKVSSTGGTNTIFFKDMDDVGNKWTGVLSNGLKPSFWTHNNSDHRWNTIASGDCDLSEWSHIAYVENNAVGSLYVNGELIGSGSVVSGAGDLYLGVTYWSADAISALVDDVKLYNTALTKDAIMADYEKYVDFENAISLPKEVISDVVLPTKIASKNVLWKTDNSDVITIDGKVTRQNVDVTVTLTATIGEEITKSFEVKVLKKPVIVNDRVLLSYVFDENDGEIIHDKSGNGNHGASYGNVVINNEGIVFDGTDDYIEMPRGVLYGNDEITLITTFTQESAQKHVFLYGFGNSSNTGYMFLNPSRPGTNTLRFAATKTTSDKEKEIASIPGIRNGEEVTVCVVVSGKYAAMYVNGDLVMDGTLDMKVSDMGMTTMNYIAKSLYDADPYFKGSMSEFKILSYPMKETDIKNEYGRIPEYSFDEEEAEEYIEAVSFENGINVQLDTKGRTDVKIAAIVLGENNIVTDFSVASTSDEISLTESGTTVVFAFNEEDNIPGNIYVKGSADGFDYEYTPNNIKLVASESYTNGMIIIAGYDAAGTLMGVALKICDINAYEAVNVTGDFENVIRFKMMYWDNLISMVPIE